MGRAERGVIAGGGRLQAAARAVREDRERAVEAVRAALTPLQEAAIARELDAIPVARLQDVTEGRVRVGSVERSGLGTVGAVLRAGPYRLRQIPGVGQQTVGRLLAAAGRLSDAVRETAAVRIDVDRPEPGTTALVKALHVLVEAGPDAGRAVDRAAALGERLDPLLAEAAPAARRFRMLFAGRARRARVLAAVAEVGEVLAEAERAGLPGRFAQASVDLLRGPASDAAAWVDFELRSAEYYSLLAEVSVRLPDTAAAEGFLPEAIAERVRTQPLDDTHRKVSLRGYQAFGARFALVQRKVVLGDEMGLGKTVQAVAVLAHLAGEGQRRFLVVCPASVLVNWTREVEARSTLRAVPLHGPDRHAAFADWAEHGGVAVTTYDALRGFPAPDAGAAAPGLLVVDEAHAVKNPGAKRSRAVAAWAGRCERVLLMTGTPMENRVEEFRNLVRMLDAERADALGAGDALAGSVAFRRAVAPVYLRRNQAEVLTELPSLQRSDEWQEPSASDEEAYREAVFAGNFMAMRRAAYARPAKSAKLGRLAEIVREAGENGQKTVVFSNFKDVLGAVREALSAEDAGAGRVFGPITGSVPAERRQLVVDEFTGSPGAAVLLAQIQAGGTGLNIQAASVVVLCEPQIKPTLEHQAVARAHRMGQVRPVHVHRLLATGGVDERLVRLLEDKTRLFDAYARRSAVAEAAVDAVDVSDTELARRIVEEEQERLAASAPPPAPPAEALAEPPAEPPSAPPATPPIRPGTGGGTG
ncbi:DEAD/DEAH box helicase [Mangrovactinospora gilvigrisea]|uniref:DEAD/DEAH box helicase n=1 Tax=Mangrovactinospora gilvigrisea TaxID=1428644 RepID=UPI0009A11D18|nr:DEAD/DEAH box helicase [Mangrovactinospora gilvigrisea]